MKEIELPSLPSLNLSRFSLAGRIVLDETFIGLIFGRHILYWFKAEKYSFLVLIMNFANLEPTSQKTYNKLIPSQIP